ncbi:hypothetical protein HPB48_014123 [Haemaphysalis longicornis]|uniref:RRM domain-containing protein n=1 Tax=Haemaphysalis longicornis TaxID=44386 RepID=A0A9J6FJT3_HAELO|nr:hypothetical protein HPB48_014123 [Haemaphysalis longicornis]
MGAQDNEIEPGKFRKLFIGRLNCKRQQRVRRATSSNWARSCGVMHDPSPRKSSRFGFITFRRAHRVDDAQAAWPQKVDVRDVERKRAKVVVGGRKDDVDVSDLRDYFSQFGATLSANLITEKHTGRKRGLAFVEQADYEPGDNTVLKRHHMLKSKRTEVNKALSKQEMENLKKDKWPEFRSEQSKRVCLYEFTAAAGSDRRGLFHQETHWPGWAARDSAADPCRPLIAVGRGSAEPSVAFQTVTLQASPGAAKEALNFHIASTPLPPPFASSDFYRFRYSGYFRGVLFPSVSRACCPSEHGLSVSIGCFRGVHTPHAVRKRAAAGCPAALRLSSHVSQFAAPPDAPEIAAAGADVRLFVLHSDLLTKERRQGAQGSAVSDMPSHSNHELVRNISRKEAPR